MAFVRSGRGNISRSVNGKPADSKPATEGSIPPLGVSMRAWSKGWASAFKADDAGSSPAVRFAGFIFHSPNLLRRGGGEKMKTITLKNVELKECPECGGEVQYQKEWDRLFDIYGDRYPAMYMATEKLYEEKEPKYVCKNCMTAILVTP